MAKSPDKKKPMKGAKPPKPGSVEKGTSPAMKKYVSDREKQIAARDAKRDKGGC